MNPAWEHYNRMCIPWPWTACCPGSSPELPRGSPEDKHDFIESGTIDLIRSSWRWGATKKRTDVAAKCSSCPRHLDGWRLVNLSHECIVHNNVQGVKPVRLYTKHSLVLSSQKPSATMKTLLSLGQRGAMQHIGASKMRARLFLSKKGFKTNSVTLGYQQSTAISLPKIRINFQNDPLAFSPK